MSTRVHSRMPVNCLLVAIFARLDGAVNDLEGSAFEIRDNVPLEENDWHFIEFGDIEVRSEGLAFVAIPTIHVFSEYLGSREVAQAIEQMNAMLASPLDLSNDQYVDQGSAVESATLAKRSVGESKLIRQGTLRRRWLIGDCLVS